MILDIFSSTDFWILIAWITFFLLSIKKIISLSNSFINKRIKNTNSEIEHQEQLIKDAQIIQKELQVKLANIDNDLSKIKEQIDIDLQNKINSEKNKMSLKIKNEAKETEEQIKKIIQENTSALIDKIFEETETELRSDISKKPKKTLAALKNKKQ